MARENRKSLELAAQMLETIRNLAVIADDGTTVARAAWRINLVFHDGDFVEVRRRAWHVLELFLSVVPREKMLWCGKGLPTPLTGKKAQTQMARIVADDLSNPNVQILPTITSGIETGRSVKELVRNAQAYHFQMCLQNTRVKWFDETITPGSGPSMSAIQMFLPIEWVEQQPLDHRAHWLTTKAVEIMQPFWATAGWGWVLPEDNISSPDIHQPAMYPFTQRFPGIEVLDRVQIQSSDFNRATYSINWLNYLSDPLLDQLGGREAIKHRVEQTRETAAQEDSGLRWDEVGNCLLIVAGDGPGTGDVTQGFGLPGYGLAARLLKPIRVPRMVNVWVAPPPGGTRNKHTLLLANDAYLSRFDDY